MKFSKAETNRKTYRIPILRFEDQTLSSFAGLVVFQRLFACLDLRQRLSGYFRHLTMSPTFGHGTIVMLLIVHLLLGYRRLKDMRYYNDDPLVRRVLGLSRLPDVSTVSRSLGGMDATSVDNVRAFNRQVLLERFAALDLARVTLDFDGPVISTGRFAEGSAVGFNRKKKGQRSYYPLFCTIAQTGQVLDVWHRPSNVHDCNGAEAFVSACLERVRTVLPHAKLEVHMDSAFFSDAMVSRLEAAGVEFTISVPFERFGELTARVEKRQRWIPVDAERAFFETDWKPKRWAERFRFLFIRAEERIQYKQPVQLDLFIPYEYGYAIKVIVTNKAISAKKVLTFHNGRGA